MSKLPTGLLTSTGKNNCCRSCPPEKVYGKFDMKNALKTKVGNVRSRNCRIFLGITFQGGQLLLFFCKFYLF